MTLISSSSPICLCFIQFLKQNNQWWFHQCLSSSEMVGYCDFVRACWVSYWFAAQLEAELSTLDDQVDARVDASMEVKGIEIKGSVDVQLRSDARPHVGLSARMSLKRECNIWDKVHVNASADVGLDVASTGFMGPCFEYGLLKFLISSLAVKSQLKFMLRSLSWTLYQSFLYISFQNSTNLSSLHAITTDLVHSHYPQWPHLTQVVDHFIDVLSVSSQNIIRVLWCKPVVIWCHDGGSSSPIAIIMRHSHQALFLIVRLHQSSTWI